MTGGALLDRVEAAGATASLDPDGRVRIAGASRLPAELLDLLRQNRAAVAEALMASAQQDPDPVEAGERAAMAEHYAAPPSANPWRPDGPDPLRDGLLAGWDASRPGRLAAAAERLEAARPRRVHGVPEIVWRAWQVAAQEAAGLSTAAWATWRARVGTAATAWPPRPAGHPPTDGAHR